MATIRRGHAGVKRIVALSRQVAIQAQAWVTSNLFGVQGVVTPTPPDTTSVLRVPLLNTQFAPRTWQQSFVTNLLLTTLAVAVEPVPITPAQASFPERFAPPSSHAALLPAQPTRFDLDTLAIPPPVEPPFTQSEWPVPRGKPPVTAGAANGLDLATLALNPFDQTDWQNPRGPKPVTPGQAQGLDLATLGQNPFVSDEFPALVRSRAGQQPETPPNLQGTTLVVVAAGTPFAQADWQNPTIIRRTVVPLLHRPTVDPATVPDAGKPFLQDQWPNPTPRLRPLIQTATRELQAWPFTQTEWPNPVRRKSQDQGFTASLSYDRFIQLDTKPFLQTEWPNPTLRVLPHEWGATAPLTYDRFVQPNVKPFLQIDWPNPGLPVLPREWGSVMPMEYDAFTTVPPIVLTSSYRPTWRPRRRG